MRLSVADIFSPWAGGRFPSDGSENGETFREKYLIPNLLEENTQKVIVSFKGTIGLGSSFKEELFGGTIRTGKVPYKILQQKLQIESDYDTDEKEVWAYIDDAHRKKQK